MKIGSEVHIHINLESCEFRKDDIKLLVKPFVNYDIKDKSITNIGENKETSGTLLINLFELESTPTSTFDKFELLTAFFAYGFGRLFENQFLPVLRPQVIIYGDKILRGALCGYERYILTEAVLLGGARNIKFANE